MKSKLKNIVEDIVKITSKISFSNSFIQKLRINHSDSSMFKFGLIISLFLVAALFVNSAGINFKDGGVYTDNLQIDDDTLYVDSVNHMIGVETIKPEYVMDIRRAGDTPFRVGKGDGNDFTIDVAAGQGLVNLVAGAKATVNNDYVYTGTRGATRILLNDNYIRFFTSNDAAEARIEDNHVDGLDADQGDMTLHANGMLTLNRQIKFNGINPQIISSDGFIDLRPAPKKDGTSNPHGVLIRNINDYGRWSGLRHIIDGGNDVLQFGVQKQGSYGANIVITGGNDVGIGTSRPAAKLEVVGEVKFQGISGDGVGKIPCILGEGTLGTCSDAPKDDGTCTCV